MKRRSRITINIENIDRRRAPYIEVSTIEKRSNYFAMASTSNAIQNKGEKRHGDFREIGGSGMSNAGGWIGYTGAHGMACRRCRYVSAECVCRVCSGSRSGVPRALRYYFSLELYEYGSA